MHPKKEDIRQRIHQQRLALSAADVRRRGDTVRGRLVGMDLYGRAGCLGCYASVKNEVDTHRLIQAALDEGKRVGVPATQEKGVMTHLEIHTFSSLRPGPFGLLEPGGTGRVEIPPGELDLVVVPGIAFDRRGNRIGFGGGYYDRFLVRTAAPKIGLAYDFQVLDRLPTDPHDIRLDFLVTEEAVYTCGDIEL